MNRNWFAADNQLITLRGVHVLIEINTESEKDVVSVDGLAVRKLQTFPQGQRVLQPVCRNFPGLRQRGFGELRRAIDMNQVGLHCAKYHFPRWRIHGSQRIQSFRLRTQRNYDPPAPLADLPGNNKGFFRSFFLSLGAFSSS